MEWLQAQAWHDEGTEELSSVPLVLTGNFYLFALEIESRVLAQISWNVHAMLQAAEPKKLLDGSH